MPGRQSDVFPTTGPTPVPVDAAGKPPANAAEHAAVRAAEAQLEAALEVAAVGKLQLAIRFAVRTFAVSDPAITNLDKVQMLCCKLCP